MTIYRIIEDSDSYDSIVLDDDVDVQIFDGRRLVGSWKPLAVQIESQGKVPDFLSFLPGAFAMPEASWDKISWLLRDDAEALPLEIAPARVPKFVAVNPIRVVDCLDRQRAKFNLLPSGAIEFPLESYAFVTAETGKVALFRLPETRRSEIIATERFRQAVESLNLTGLIFQRLA
ncbi:MAG TPA: hypothetical protein VFS43_16200 [Polyangiaceae bacterium]|nr:hypothetical protein [Polyangiaceae bacterium]